MSGQPDEQGGGVERRRIGHVTEQEFHYPDGVEPHYLVVRAHPDLPDGFLPPDWEGRWIERSRIPMGPSVDRPLAPGEGRGVATAIDRYEIRDDDGAVAQVYEVRP